MTNIVVLYFLKEKKIISLKKPDIDVSLQTVQGQYTFKKLHRKLEFKKKLK